MNNAKNRQVATLGSGCFCCTEAVFNELEGVEKVESGYSGGELPNPACEQVCTGITAQQNHSDILVSVNST